MGHQVASWVYALSSFLLQGMANTGEPPKKQYRTVCYRGVLSGSKAPKIREQSDLLSVFWNYPLCSIDNYSRDDVGFVQWVGLAG
jgi:hypothetical protein